VSDLDTVLWVEPLRIEKERADYRAHTIPEAWDKPTLRKTMTPWHPQNTAGEVRVHADRSVTTCPCCEPVIKDGMILGVRKTASG
jgi:hypothetical protein